MTKDSNYFFVKVDKLEQSDAMRSEEEHRAEEKPLVFSKSIVKTRFLYILGPG